MSAITIGGDLVHYEDLGRGKPIILLHSWLGSWRYWIPTMQQLSVSKYRTYAVDLWGFGDSGKNKLAYHLEGQVELLHGFMEKMGIPKAVLVGHGLGAAVVSRYAASSIDRAQKVHRMVLIAPPLFDTGPGSGAAPRALTANRDFAANPAPPNSSSASSYDAYDAPTLLSGREGGIDREKLRQAALASKLETSGDKELPRPLTTEEMQPPPAAAPIAEPVTTTSQQSLLSKNPLVEIMGETDPQRLLSKHVDASTADYEKLRVEVAKTAEGVLAASARDIHTFREVVNQNIPTLVLLGTQDTFMRSPEKTLHDRLRERAQMAVVEFEGVRHFPMLEDPSKFTRLMREFLEAQDVNAVQFKDEWRRRTR